MIQDTFTTDAILGVFTDEVQQRGGQVAESFRDGERLIVRALLPHGGEARPRDRMQGGLALRTTEDELWLHPYLYRQVCNNGAIMASAVESLRVDCRGDFSLEEGTGILREVIAKCAAEDVFNRSMDDIRVAAMTDVDMMLNVMPILARLRGAGMGQLMHQILAQFMGGSDPTQFGFMNAVTSVAREERDPETRWQLEELGGGIGARILPRQPVNEPGVALVG